MKRSWVLTETEKQELVRRYKAGERVSDIAAHFGVTKNSVSRAAIQRGYAPTNENQTGGNNMTSYRRAVAQLARNKRVSLRQRPR